MVRVNNNPSVELHETDRSNYDSTVDNSTVGTSTLVCGFFDKGEDYAVTWVNSIGTLQKLYGTPKNDAETWSYNACTEILNGGGVLYVAKLPYDNISKDRISYTSYTVGDNGAFRITPTDKFLKSEIVRFDGTVVTLLEELLEMERKFPDGLFELSDPEAFENTSPLAKSLIDHVLKRTSFGWKDKENFTSIMLSGEKARVDSPLLLRSILSREPEFSTTEKSRLVDVYGFEESVIDGIRIIYDDYVSLMSDFSKTITPDMIVHAYSTLNEYVDSSENPLLPDVYKLGPFISSIEKGRPELADLDPSIDTFVEIHSHDVDEKKSGTVTMDEFDLLKTGGIKVPPNQIRIFDITRCQYGNDWNVQTGRPDDKYFNLVLDQNMGILEPPTTIEKCIARGENRYTSVDVPEWPTDNFMFAGWYDSSVGGNMVYDPCGNCVAGLYWTHDNEYCKSGDLTVYAHWVADNTGVGFDLSFEPNGGTITGTVPDEIGYLSKINNTAPVPTREGYHFVGWFTSLSDGKKVYDKDGNCIIGEYFSDCFTPDSVQYIHDGNLSLYAHWVPDAETRFSITANPNGGSYKGTSSPFVRTSAEAECLRYMEDRFYDIGNAGSDNPTWENHRFLGWFTEPDGGLQVYDKNGLGIKDSVFWDKSGRYVHDKNLVLYAHWAYDGYSSDEYLGIVPVITTAANALAYQGQIKSMDFGEKYNLISSLQTVWNENRYKYDQAGQKKWINYVEVEGKNLAEPLGSTDVDIWTTGKSACENFPKITTGADGKLERKYLKQIGLVVFRMIRDASVNNLVRLVPAESFIGSLDPNERDPVTNRSLYIGNQVNTNSNLVNFFSNVKFSRKDDVVRDTPCDLASIYCISNQDITSLGFFASDRMKDISVKKSILEPLDLIFNNASNTNTLDLDIILDAGVSNIAQFIASTKVIRENKDGTKTKITNRLDRKGEFDLLGDDAKLFSQNSPDASVVWRLVVEKYKNFCQNVRKDCMFICDGLRNICLDGNQKIIRRTAPANTVENSILPYIKNISGINTSYGAGYCDWFLTQDSWSNDLFWCPPSIKTVGRYLYTDKYGSYWLAPAGLHRGILNDVVDIAFSMTDSQAGFVYGNCWNYATSWPIDGIAVEGQRTFQVEKTALDRVNVRRLLLGLEKSVRRIGRYFLYEGLTQYNVQRFSDALNRILSDVQDAGGIRDFVVICDNSNNTDETIDRNELHATIALIPVKSIEWIVVNTVTTNQGANVEEIARAEL